MANKVLRAAALKRNIEMTEGAIAKIAEFRQSEYGTSPVPEVIEGFLDRFKREMEAKLDGYREELEEIQLGLDSQAGRKEFFARLRENLANGDPDQEDRLADGFRALILGQ